MHPMKAMFQVHKRADGLWLKTGAADRCGKGQRRLECFLLNTHSVRAALGAWMARARGGATTPVGKAKFEIGRGRMESIPSKAKGDRQTH